MSTADIFIYRHICLNIESLIETLYLKEISNLTKFLSVLSFQLEKCFRTIEHTHTEKLFSSKFSAKT